MKSAIETVQALNRAFAATESRLLAEIAELKVQDCSLRADHHQQQELLSQRFRESDRRIANLQEDNARLQVGLGHMRSNGRASA